MIYDDFPEGCRGGDRRWLRPRGYFLCDDGVILAFLEFLGLHKHVPRRGCDRVNRLGLRLDEFLVDLIAHVLAVERGDHCRWVVVREEDFEVASSFEAALDNIVVVWSDDVAFLQGRRHAYLGDKVVVEV